VPLGAVPVGDGGDGQALLRVGAQLGQLGEAVRAGPAAALQEDHQRESCPAGVRFVPRRADEGELLGMAFADKSEVIPHLRHAKALRVVGQGDVSAHRCLLHGLQSV